MAFNSKSIFQFASKSDIIKLAVLHTVCFVILQFIRVSLLMGNESTDNFYALLLNKLSLPATFGELLYQPWSVITYMFAELDFLSILGNMVWLWIFGTVIEDLKGAYRIIPIYLTGGVVGALCMLAINTVKPSLIMMPFFRDALAALFAVAIAATTYKPKYRFSLFFGFEIPIWVMLFVFAAIRISIIQRYTVPLMVYVLGGIVIGLLYTNVLNAYFDTFTSMLKRFSNFFDNNNNFVKQKNRNLKVHKNSIDDILDKINNKGIHSLTKEEKRRLEEYSKNS